MKESLILLLAWKLYQLIDKVSYGDARTQLNINQPWIFFPGTDHFPIYGADAGALPEAKKRLEVQKSIARVNIYFRSMHQINTTEELKYKIIDMLSDMGWDRRMYVSW